MDDIDLIYIAGYGRSGSTLLDITVSNDSSCTSIGAGAHVFEWFVNDGQCACGDPVRRCPIWSRVGSRIDETFPDRDMIDLLRIQRRVEGRRRYLLPWPGRGVRRADWDVYRRANRLVLEEVSRAAGVKAIVDSSGTSGQCMGRAGALSRLDGVNVKLMKLTRDPRAVVSSALRKPGSPEREQSRLPPLLQTVKVALSWSLSSAASDRIGSRPEIVPCRIRYEDFVRSPTDELERMARELELDFGSVIGRLENGEPLRPRHNIAGNRLRFEEAIHIRSNTSYSLDSPYFAVASALTLPLRRLYRYD